MFRLELLDCYGERGSVVASDDPQRRGIAQPRHAKIPDILSTHGIQILLMGDRVNSNQPEQVILLKVADHLDAVNGFPPALVLLDNTGHHGIHLGTLEFLQAHVSAADGHGLLRHMGNRLCVR